MKKTMTICFANNKGGSGKSTTCSNVGYGLSTLGKKVLLIDGDMQMNLTLAFFGEEETLEFASSSENLYYGIKGEKDLSSCIVPTKYSNLDLIPSSTLMSSIEYELFSKTEREVILEKGLRKIKEGGTYDYILIDAPPTLGGWVMNILTASDRVIIPVEASPWGLFGLANMFEFLEMGKEKVTGLELLGIAITKVDTRKNYFKQTKQTLEELEGVRIFESCIRVDSTVEWAQDNSAPVVAYRKSSRSAKEYLGLAKEIEQYASWKR